MNFPKNSTKVLLSIGIMLSCPHESSRQIHRGQRPNLARQRVRGPAHFGRGARAGCMACAHGHRGAGQRALAAHTRGKKSTGRVAGVGCSDPGARF